MQKQFIVILSLCDSFRVVPNWQLALLSQIEIVVPAVQQNRNADSSKMNISHVPCMNLINIWRCLCSIYCLLKGFYTVSRKKVTPRQCVIEMSNLNVS